MAETPKQDSSGSAIPNRSRFSSWILNKISPMGQSLAGKQTATDEKKNNETLLESPKPSQEDRQQTVINSNASETVSEINPEKEEAQAEQQYLWIEDDGLLRDEGVLFGLSYSEQEPKVAAIEGYYAEQLSHAEKKLSDYRLGQTLLEDKLALIRKEIEETESKYKEVEKPLPLPVKELLRPFLSTLGYTFALGMNWYLIYVLLTPFWTDKAMLISIGAYIFGTFSIFTEASFFFTANARLKEKNEDLELWKTVVQEALLPLISAAFVTISAWYAFPAGISIISGLFIFFIFLFAGKSFLHHWGQLRRGLTDLRRCRKENKQRRRQSETYSEELNKQASQLKVVQNELIVYRQDEIKLPNPDAILKRCEGKVKLFKSEFDLARQYRDKLPARQRQLFN